MPDTHPDTHGIADRFWAKVEKRGERECWPWTGARFHFGHGAFKVSGRPWGAHRIAWQLTFGRPIPTEMRVLHRCDRPECCNPAHLYLGTLADNGRDMGVRGRVANAKLTVSEVQVARLRFQTGERICDIAASMSLPPKSLREAIRGETFAYLPGAVPPVHHRRRHEKLGRALAG